MPEYAKNFIYWIWRTLELDQSPFIKSSYFPVNSKMGLKLRSGYSKCTSTKLQTQKSQKPPNYFFKCNVYKNKDFSLFFREKKKTNLYLCLKKKKVLQRKKNTPGFVSGLKCKEEYVLF